MHGSCPAVPASELPVPRALHSLTCLGQKFVVIGGVGPAGPVPDVHLLECPAVTRGLQLQQQCLDSQTQLVHSRQRSAQMYAEVVSGRTELQERNRQLQVSMLPKGTQIGHELMTLNTAAAQAG